MEISVKVNNTNLISCICWLPSSKLEAVHNCRPMPAMLLTRTRPFSFSRHPNVRDRGSFHGGRPAGCGENLVF